MCYTDVMGCNSTNKARFDEGLYTAVVCLCLLKPRHNHSVRAEFMTFTGKLDLFKYHVSCVKLQFANTISYCIHGSQCSFLSVFTVQNHVIY